MRKKINSYIIPFLFVVIFLVACFFRVYDLSSVPPTPSLDEVTIGYNAYSILQTGKDEFGNRLPILLRAYDDYRPALYVYEVIPFVKILGLQALSVRLPSVIMSLGVVVATFFLGKLIFSEYKYKYLVGLISSLLLAISPWHIYVSRLGHEVNAGLTTVVLGSLFFLLSLKNKKFHWAIIVSAICFALSFYTYQSEKIFVPFLLLLLGICFWKDLLLNKKNLGIAIIFGIIIFIPIFKASLSPQALIRFNGTSAFSNLDYAYMQSSKQLIIDKRQGNFVGEVFDNRRLVPIRVFLGNYFSHFNPLWLYANSGEDSFKAPGTGLFYPWEILAIVFGAFSLMRIKNKKTKAFLFGWIGIAFIAPGITTQAPHALRAFNVLPIPQIIESFGIVQIIIFFKNRFEYILIRLTGYIVGFAFLVSLALGCFSFFTNYFYYFPHEQSEPFTYALAQALTYVTVHHNEYKKIVFSNQNNLYQSYMFFLFFDRYSPKKYLQEGGTKSGGFAATHAFGSFEFRPIQWNLEEKKDTLFIGNPEDFPDGAPVKANFYYLDGKKGVSIVYF